VTTPEPQTLLFGTAVYGDEPPVRDDPAELFHEASRYYPDVADTSTVGGALLTRSPELRASVTRAVRRRTGLAAVPLPRVEPRDGRLAELLAARRSTRAYGDAPLRLAQVSTLLDASYGVTGALGPQTFRAVPSGGALYPLELYLAAQHVQGLERALYHFDPLRAVLERIRPVRDDELEGLTPYDELLVPSAAVIMIAAVFWRSRFKYGARAYRFALLEAGHVAQNFLLAATELGLAACPVGGFYDRRVDAFLGLDGLYEATLYLLPVGESRP
jgi:SagB-type dehydrogenase family enzyme